MVGWDATWQLTVRRPSFALVRIESGPGTETAVSVTRLGIGASAYSSPICSGRLPQSRVEQARALVRFRPCAFAHLRELLRFTEILQCGLRLRVDRDQMTPRVCNAEHRVIDLETDHRLDEVEFLGERVFVDLALVALQELFVISDHCRVDREVRVHAGAATRMLGDARVALRSVLLRVVRERRPRVERAAEAARVESFDRSG